MSDLLIKARKKISLWKRDPVRFVVDELHVTPDPWQINVLRAFANPDKQRIAMKACKGPGKTAIEAWCILNFLGCYGEKGEHPKGAAVSITGDNIDDNLWPEIAKWMDRSEYLKAMFKWTKTRVFARHHEETWFFSKRTWPRSGDATQQANTLAGLHAKYILFVLDESGGIPMPVMATADAALSTRGGWKKIMQGGNPTHLEGPLYAACTTEKHLWHVVEITGDPDDPERSPRISKKWAREQIDKYGKDNPWVLINVFGKFPPSSINSLLGPEEVASAMKRHYDEDKYQFSQKRLGIDVARFGDDLTVLFPRQGIAALRPAEMRNSDGPQIAGRVALAKERWGSEVEFIDDTGGWGASAIDALKQGGLMPIPVPFSGKAIDPRYYNKRAEMWFNMANWVKKGGALPNCPELVGELTTPTYTFKSGKMILEPKDQIKERLGRSPNYADALALTFALPDMPGTPSISGMPPISKHVSDWNPLEER